MSVDERTMAYIYRLPTSPKVRVAIKSPNEPEIREIGAYDTYNQAAFTVFERGMRLAWEGVKKLARVPSIQSGVEGDEADSFAKPTGSHIILPNEKNFFFHDTPEIPKADIVVPGGQFAIEGVDTPVNPERPYLPRTKARIAKQQPKGRNPVKYGGPTVGSVLVVGGALLLVGMATTRKH